MKPEGLSRDYVLDNITLYWLTNTAIFSARLSMGTRRGPPPGGFFDARGVKLPVGVSAFAEEIYQAPKSWSEKAYVNLIHYNKFTKGTDYAAWEQTAIFVSENACNVQIIAQLSLGAERRVHNARAALLTGPIRLCVEQLPFSASPTGAKCPRSPKAQALLAGLRKPARLRRKPPGGS